MNKTELEVFEDVSCPLWTKYICKTELEVFEDVSCPLWAKYICYKVYCTTINKKPSPPAVWVCAQTLMLIDRGLLEGTDRKDAEEALNALGWASRKNDRGQTVLWPLV